MAKAFSNRADANEVRDSIYSKRSAQNNTGTVDFTAKVLTLTEVVAEYITGDKELEDGFYIVTSSLVSTENGWRQGWKVRGSDGTTTAAHIPTVRKNLRNKAERVVFDLFNGHPIAREIDWAIAEKELNGILSMPASDAVDYVEKRFLAAKGL